MTLPLLTDLPAQAGQKNLENKRVLVRLDLNVPLSESGEVRDDFRIRKSLATLKFLREHGARPVLLSHIGREPEESLRPVVSRIETLLGEKIFFAENISQAREAGRDKNATLVLLENLRQDAREEAGDESFAKELAGLGDIFVNEAFSASHRAHASIVGIPKFLPSFAGLQFAKEVEHLSRALSPEHPFFFLLGGAKFETKLPFLKKFEEIADSVFVGGALGNDILRAQGYAVGQSFVETNPPEYVGALARNAKLLATKDVVVISGDEESEDGEEKQNATTKPVGEIGIDERIVDAGEETVRGICDEVKKAKGILMNGPLGLYEKGFDEGTKKVLQAIADSSAVSIIGGGDTVALIDQMGLEGKFSFVSTAGGAMLDFLADGELPGIAALMKVPLS